MIRKLSKNHRILCTSRNYREVVKLAKLKHVNVVIVGKHGGASKEQKLLASIKRMEYLYELIRKISPDITISFCSPEAARISYGFGIKHLAFSDSPHAEAVMRLSVPFVQKLLIPWIIPKNEFVRYGISRKDIIHYKAIDASVIVKEKSKIEKVPVNKSKKTIVIRPEETEAAYVSGLGVSSKIIYEVSKQRTKYNVVVLARYYSQKNRLRDEFDGRIMVMDKVVDGKSLLSSADVFIGSGGTMTAESALMGIPTISYNAVPNHIEKYLVRIGLIRRETNPKKIPFVVKNMLQRDRQNREKAKRILDSMEDPYSKLIDTIRTIQNNIN